MPHPALYVDAPGLLSTVQDRGRPGFAAQGVPVGGAMDAEAASVANLLAGNASDAAVLEMTLTGPTLRALRDVAIALCGANLSPLIDDRPVPMWHTARLKQGQTLRFARREGGARAYLALGGGLAVPLVLGSRATELRAGFGGFAGRALRAGDVLDAYTESAAGFRAGRGLRASDVPPYPAHVPLRVVLGPQDDLFDDAARETFLSAHFAVTAQSSRMGCRLQGPPLALRFQTPDTLPSEGVTFGCVQVAGGQALLLMADCQTTGGYPVMGVVIGADLSQAAQCVPGTTVSFQSVSISDSHDAWRARQRFLRTLACAVGR